MVPSRLDPPTRTVWSILREQMASALGAAQDARRAEGVLAKRRDAALMFFTNEADAWDAVRRKMIGARTDLLALLDLLDDRWVVGDLGCGGGHISDALAPCVAKVIAVDESGPMLGAARDRLATHANVELRVGVVEELPIDDGTLDAAVLFLVAHFVTDPMAAMREVQRVLKPGGRVLIVDLVSHDRVDYVIQLGHVWQGFDGDEVKDWLSKAGLVRCRYRVLPPDPQADAPALFAATARKAS
jgi:ArsR family transcriptional regulator